jgi:nitrate reductase beta subunit
MAQHEQVFCSLDTPGGPGMGGAPAGSVAEFHGAGTPGAGSTFRDDQGEQRFNLFGWDAAQPAPHLFPGEGGTS